MKTKISLTVKLQIDDKEPTEHTVDVPRVHEDRFMVRQAMLNGAALTAFYAAGGELEPKSTGL